MSAQHTPGPWEANGPFVNSGAVTCIADCSRAEIAENWAGRDYSTEVHTEANARLIAAAPDLLKALNDARNYVEATVLNASNSKTRENYGGCLRRIDEAIAKATGSAS